MKDIDQNPISGNVYSFISVGNELPLSSWGNIGSAIPSMFWVCWPVKLLWSIRSLIQYATRSGTQNYVKVTQVIFRTILFDGDLRWHLYQWTVLRSGRDKWIPQNMWYPEPEYYLSAASGTLSINSTPFEWDIRRDMGSHEYLFILIILRYNLSCYLELLWSWVL